MVHVAKDKGDLGHEGGAQSLKSRAVLWYYVVPGAGRRVVEAVRPDIDAIGRSGEQTSICCAFKGIVGNDDRLGGITWAWRKVEGRKRVRLCHCFREGAKVG